MKLITTLTVINIFILIEVSAQNLVQHTYNAGGALISRNYKPAPPPCGGIGEPACAERLAMHTYPNPASSNTTLIIDEAINETTLNVEVISLDGRIVKKFTTITKSTDFNVADLVNGIYFIRVANSQNTTQQLFNKIE
jgi:hypothetical protein